MLTWEGVVSMGFTSVTTGGFLAAFALALGANNFQIGMLGAIPFLAQPLQIPTILLVEKLRHRKATTVIAWLMSHLLWFPIALIPLLTRFRNFDAVPMLLVLMAMRGMLNAVTNCSWSSWIRDLVPQAILGRYFSRRLALATAVAIAFGLGAAFFIDWWRGNVTVQEPVLAYTYILIFGALFLGLASPVFMSFMPEPLMPTPTRPQPSLWQATITPLKDRNFKQLMSFLLYWNFASNLAIPFFTVYMLQRLGLPLTTVIALSVLSQLFNILFLRVWGPLADRFGSKVVLSLCASLYLLVILGWAFAYTSQQYFSVIFLLVALHVFAGVATAGISLTVETLNMKLAPHGKATSYLAGASLATNLGTGVGALAGGLTADFFGKRSLMLDLTWIDPGKTISLGVVHLTGLDFLFALAFVVGFMTLMSLTTFHEEGEASREVVLGELMTQTRSISRWVSSVPGLNFLYMFPFSYLRKIPGVDVAIAVTAYQLGDVAKKISSAVPQKRKQGRKKSSSDQTGEGDAERPQPS